MNNLDKFLEKYVKENSQEYIIEECNKFAFYDNYIDILKTKLLGELAAGEIDYREFKRRVKNLTD